MSNNGTKNVYPYVTGPDGPLGKRIVHTGLTKRELFAAMAMQGLVSRPFGSYKDKAVQAIGLADALIEALEDKT